MANVQAAYDNFSRSKHKRKAVRDYDERLDSNLDRVLHELRDESWMPSPYRPKVVVERKRRELARAPIHDHVLEAAAILPYETTLYDYIAWQCPAVRPNMGQHALLRVLRNELFGCSQSEVAYNLSMDAHHYFPLMDHDILKRQILRKVKPGKLQRVLFKVVDSYLQGAPLGVKVSQIFGMLYLADFDRLAMRFFDIGNDPERLAYWTSKYIEGRIITARSPEDYADLCRGPAFLADKFRRYVAAGLPHYSRFVDNIIFRHEDKTVLGIVRIIAVAILARDYHVQINRDYNIRPTHMGIRICGYVFFHDRVLLAKHNKQELARHVAKLQKRGFDEEQIRLRQASRFGYAKHANCIHLFKTLGMEKSLGKIIKSHRVKAPFEEMTGSQKINFSLICKTLTEVNGGGRPDTWNKKILLEDYKIEDSKIDRQKVTVSVPDSSGNLQEITKVVASKVLAIRFKKILETLHTEASDGSVQESYVFEKARDREGNPTLLDAEFYAFTGSKVLIDQAQKDFSHEDLPAPTVIQQFEGKKGQTFFKIT